MESKITPTDCPPVAVNTGRKDKAMKKCMNGTSGMTKQEILDYSKECGKEAAANLLILVGPDGFAGSYAEYEALEAELNQ